MEELRNKLIFLNRNSSTSEEEENWTIHCEIPQIHESFLRLSFFFFFFFFFFSIFFFFFFFLFSNLFLNLELGKLLLPTSTAEVDTGEVSPVHSSRDTSCNSHFQDQMFFFFFFTILYISLWYYSS